MLSRFTFAKQAPILLNIVGITVDTLCKGA